MRRAPAPGLNSDAVRRGNLSALIRQVHIAGGTSRSDLVALTGLNRSTVGALVGDLVERGLVTEEQGDRLGLPGRPSPTVQAAPDGALVLAVDIAVDSLAVAVVGLGGVVRQRVRLDHRVAGMTPGAAVDEVVRLARPLLVGPIARERLVAVGVAIVGVVRIEDGFVHLAPNLGWTDVPLAELIGDALGGDTPVVVGNEADLGAVAEHTRGAGVGVADLVYVSGEVGIGGGVITGGRPLAGAAGYGGEIGHMGVNPNGLLCRCGSRGCWETEAGEEALLRHHGGRGTGREAVEALFLDAASGSRPALAALEQVARWLGIGLASLVNIFNPTLVVLGALFGRVYEYAADIIRRELDERSLAVAHRLVTVVPSRLGVDAPLLGAAELAFGPVLDDPVHWSTRAARRSVALPAAATA